MSVQEQTTAMNERYAMPRAGAARAADRHAHATDEAAGPLRVTSCQVYLQPRPDERLLGFASIVFNHAFAVRDLRIIRGREGLFVAMPNRRGRDGRFHDIAHPIVASLREHIESVVLAEYEKAQAAQPPAPPSPAEAPNAEA